MPTAILHAAHQYPAPPHPVLDAGRWYLAVPWDRADDLRSRLRRQGHPATLCLDPEARAARLELWPDVDPASAGDALATLLAPRVSAAMAG